MSKQKNALITGASEGIGRAFAKQLAAEGYAVTAVARNETRLKELIENLNSKNHSYQTADLSTRDGTDKIAAILSKTGFDLFINNAGFGIYGEFYKTDLSKLTPMMYLNCDALVALSHAYLQKARKGDALINISSILAFLPMTSAGLYSATKAFVTSFSESLWYEQKKRGVYVMGLCPGVTATNFHKRAGGTKENQPPAAITQTPEKVVKVAMKALIKRKRPTVVSGTQNIILTHFVRFLSRKSIVGMMAKFG